MEALSFGRRFIRPFSLAIGHLAMRLGEWHSIARERRALASLDDAMLKDIGITRADVDQETAKPFWHR
jgi:uncharacterized protein YjiS (DUF1127 family)